MCVHFICHLLCALLRLMHQPSLRHPASWPPYPHVCVSVQPTSDEDGRRCHIKLAARPALRTYHLLPPAEDLQDSHCLVAVRCTTEALEHPKKIKSHYPYNFFHRRRYYPESGALESPSKTPSFRPLTWVYLVFLMWVSRTVTTKIHHVRATI